MTYDRDADRLALLEATLSHAAFDGWSQKAFDAGARDAGIPADRALNAFPGGLAELLAFYHEVEDAAMLEAMARANVSEMRVRDRIAFAVRARLQRNTRHREAIKSACSFLAMPHNAALALRLLYRTVDAMWYGAGDNATDFNFYTKRGLLAGVYSATVLYWLNDKSALSADTWSFLDRRIDEVMQVPKLLGKVGAITSRFPNPFRVAQRMRPRGFRARRARG
ncbi:MAG TPA: COQ9 family protein [Dongiaceae bacterium]|jgi:ubiquinone biosynthesis protein COQ9|nr:COQ9 family protein [Dongiaceae bacterium]